MKKKCFKWIGVCAAVLFLASTLSCDSGSSEEPITEEVVYMARGMFGLISMAVFDGTAGSEPGLTITESGLTTTMVLEDYSPEAGFTLNGRTDITEVATSPYQMYASGTTTVSGTQSIVVVINATGTWAAGKDPDDEGPSFFSGTFVYNGVSYDIARIMEILLAEGATPYTGPPL